MEFPSNFYSRISFYGYQVVSIIHLQTKFEMNLIDESVEI